MDVLFWIGLLAGALLSLVGSVIANLYTDNIYTFVGRRTKIFAEKRKTRELKIFYLVTLIVRGKIDRNALYISKAMNCIYYLIVCAIAAVMLLQYTHLEDAFKTVTLSNFNFSFNKFSQRVSSDWVNFLMQIMLIVSMFFCIFASMRISNSFYDIWGKVDDYSRYRAKIKSLWPREVATIEGAIRTRGSKSIRG